MVLYIIIHTVNMIILDMHVFEININRRYMAEILQTRRKPQYNQSINDIK